MRRFSNEQLLADIQRAVSPESFDAATYSSLAAFDALQRKISDGRELVLACRDGCSLCCSLRVDVFAHEAFLIARYIRAVFELDELAELMTRLEHHASKVLPLTPFEHATTNLPCPMLRDGSCTVYAVRGHSCRRHHSQDLAACQYTFDHPTDLETPAAHDRELFRRLTEAMQCDAAAFAASGFDPTIYELGTAVHEALTDPESWIRWTRREQAFLQASVTPSR